MLGELKQCFLEAYDDNQDGKIEIREVGPQISTRVDCSSLK
jgi:Ca2+-binding EF-hand superfamily protein